MISAPAACQTLAVRAEYPAAVTLMPVELGDARSPRPKKTVWRLGTLVAATVAVCVLLPGCAHHPTTANETASHVGTPSAGGHSSSSSHHTATMIRPAQNLPDHTGIPACDDYLSSYLACHRAGAIFSSDQLQTRYQMMRTSLLRDSLDPDIRSQLANRCNSLAVQLREALHGKPCTPNPVPASTTP